MIIMVVDAIIAFLLIVRFFFSTSMANILLLGGVSVRQHHSYRLLLIHSCNIVSFRVKFFVVHCEAMSMILTFWMITQNQ